jgi:hypothetical protein
MKVAAAHHRRDPLLQNTPRRAGVERVLRQRAVCRTRSFVVRRARKHRSTLPPGLLRTEPDAKRSGLAATICAFVIWGVFPLYLRALAAVTGQILSHRIVWSCVLVFGWIAWRGRLSWCRLRNPRGWRRRRRA